MNASLAVMALKLCVLVAAAAGLGTVVPADDLSAGSAVIAIGSGTANAGEEAWGDLQALGVPEPGLQAWTIDISYNPSIVSLTGCQSNVGSVCVLSYGTQIDRITGASATGLAGDATLATMTYRCEAAGVSPLELVVIVLSDSGSPEEPNADHTVQNSTIACVEPSEPTATEESSPTATTASLLPPTGTGNESGDALRWLILTLTGAGGVALAFLGALHLHARRQQQQQ
jgi:hypothetical protein